MAVHWPYMTSRSPRRRSHRLEVRTTAEDRALIDRAVRATGGDLTDFVITNLRVAARRVLADRSHFFLDEAAAAAWDELNERPARDLPGVRRLMDRKSPFDE